MKEEQLWITTNDNPFDFFTQFDDWYLFDESKGYHTCSLVARVARTSSELSDYENRIETERAIDQILSFDSFGIYKKIRKEI